MRGDCLDLFVAYGGGINAGFYFSVFILLIAIIFSYCQIQSDQVILTNTCI
jgi:hypothetical protein